jgi:hypothetical protein
MPCSAQFSEMCRATERSCRGNQYKPHDQAHRDRKCDSTGKQDDLEAD